MKRVLAIGFVLALFGGSANLSAQQIVFNTQEFAPFTFMSGTTVSGPAVDIVKAVCAEAGITYSVQLLPWTRAQEEVASGKAQALFLVGWNKERAEVFHFSPPILDTEYGVFVNADNPMKFASADQLAGKTVGVYGPSNTATALEDLRKTATSIVVDMTPDDESAFRKLDLKRVDAVFSNRDVGNSLVTKLKLANVRYAGRAKTLKYYIAFSKQYTDKAISDGFVAAYKKLYALGTIKKILDAARLTIAALE